MSQKKNLVIIFREIIVNYPEIGNKYFGQNAEFLMLDKGKYVVKNVL
jgi:hypothetical protein